MYIVYAVHIYLRQFYENQKCLLIPLTDVEYSNRPFYTHIEVSIFIMQRILL